MDHTESLHSQALGIINVHHSGTVSSPTWKAMLWTVRATLVFLNSPRGWYTSFSRTCALHARRQVMRFVTNNDGRLFRTNMCTQVCEQACSLFF